MIALLDPDNLKVTKNEDGQTLIEVEWPPDLAAEFAERGKESQPSLVAFELRTKMRRALDNGATLDEEAAEAVWRVASELSGQDYSGDGGEPNSPIVACAAAGAALEMLAPEWLQRFPDRHVWCEEAVLGAMASNARIGSITHGMSMYLEHVETFAGEWALARLVAGDRRDAVLRVLAESIMASEHIVTGQVLAAAERVAGKIPDDLRRLFYLLWRWAALCSLPTRLYGDDAWREEVHAGRRESLVRAFVDGRLSKRTVSWEELRLRAARVYERWKRRRRASRPSWLGETSGEDGTATPPPALPSEWMEYQNHGFSWGVLEKVSERLPVVVRPALSTHFGPVVEFDRRVLDLVVFALGHASSKRDSERSSPNLFERHAIARLCTLIAGHEDDATAMAVWQQIGSLLPAKSKWGEVFFESYFRRPREDSERAERFHRRWRSMIDSTKANAEWQPGAEGWTYHLKGAWSALLGVHERGSNLGTEADRQYLAELVDHYERWAEICLADRWRLRSFCYFLQKPGAAELRLSALAWVRKALADLEGYLPYEHDLVAEVAAFCASAWYANREDLLTVPDARAALVAIVQRLSEMHVREISELKEDLERAMAAGGERS